jgi:hypothetical protein
MGDFNINLLNFETHNKTRSFLDNIIAHGSLSRITKPTNTVTIIDHIYSNNQLQHYQSGIIITDLADHFGIVYIENDMVDIPKATNMKQENAQ